jgi:hypothetical protein
VKPPRSGVSSEIGFVLTQVILGISRRSIGFVLGNSIEIVLPATAFMSSTKELASFREIDPWCDWVRLGRPEARMIKPNPLTTSADRLEAGRSRHGVRTRRRLGSFWRINGGLERPLQGLVVGPASSDLPERPLGC